MLKVLIGNIVKLIVLKRKKIRRGKGHESEKKKYIVFIKICWYFLVLMCCLLACLQVEYGC